MDWTLVLVVLSMLFALVGGWIFTRAWRSYSKVMAFIALLASAACSIALLGLAQLDQRTGIPVYQPCVWLVLFFCAAYVSYYRAKRKEEKDTQTVYEG